MSAPLLPLLHTVEGQQLNREGARARTCSGRWRRGALLGGVAGEMLRFWLVQCRVPGAGACAAVADGCTHF